MPDYYYNVSNETLNGSKDFKELPYNMTFNQDSAREVVLYFLMFVIAGAGNIPVFVTLFRCRHKKSRSNLMVMHLAIADLIVTFVMIPLEIAWRITVEWVAGNAACKIMLYFRAFGPYLSSSVLVCLSLDRYFAILHPLKVNDAQKRGKLMLLFAWTISTVCSIPQSIIFHVENHPEYPQFLQCVPFHFFSTPYHNMAYNFFCLLGVYGVPLTIIIYCYSRILWSVVKRSRDSEVSFVLENLPHEPQSRRRVCLRYSNPAQLERTRARTLRMTVTIVLAFCCCWIPYVALRLRRIFVSEDVADYQVQSSLFLFAVSNSCVNPLVYGSCVLDVRRAFGEFFCRRSPPIAAESVSRSQTTTPPAKRDLQQRDVSVRLKHNGTGTYLMVVETEVQFPMSLGEGHSSHSCGKLCALKKY